MYTYSSHVRQDAYYANVSAVATQISIHSN
jgi:hypothetical protein